MYNIHTELRLVSRLQKYAARKDWYTSSIYISYESVSYCTHVVAANNQIKTFRLDYKLIKAVCQNGALPTAIKTSPTMRHADNPGQLASHKILPRRN